MVVMRGFLSIVNKRELILVENPRENCNHDHIPFDLKGNENIFVFLSLHMQKKRKSISLYLFIIIIRKY